MQFTCEPRELHIVKKSLEGFGLKPTAARQEYIPHTFVTLDADCLHIASEMLDGLSTIEEVVRVFDNITDDSSWFAPQQFYLYMFSASCASSLNDWGLLMSCAIGQ